MELKCLCCVGLTIILTGCASKQAPNQFQGSVGQWDEEVSEQCKVVAITLVLDALGKAKQRPTDSQIKEALVNVYGQCLITNGRKA